ncbi:MAG: LPS export ABC transporter permease LptF [Sphingomicrobium sp.]
MVLGRPILRRLGLIDRYLARSIAVPLIGSLVLAAMLLVLDKMLRLFQFVVEAGGPVSVVWRMLANLLPEYLSLGIPIGLMLGILLAFRKLALSSELDAMRGIGIGFGRLLRVPYFFAVPLLLINLGIVGYLAPFTEYRYEQLRFDLKAGALGASIKVGEFNQLGKRFTLRIDRSEKDGSQLHGIFVAADQPKGMKVTATAEYGRFLSTDDPDVILFRLEKGRLIQDSPKFAAPRTLAFDSYDLPINLPAIDRFRNRGGSKSDELYLHELWRMGYGGGTSDSHLRLETQSNFNFRLVEVLIMAMLPLMAVALAVPPKRSSSALGIFIAIVAVVAYHKINQYGEDAATNGQFNPILAMWIPLLLFAGGIYWMYHVLAHRPGGQPIAALEKGATMFGRMIRRLLARASGA